MKLTFLGTGTSFGVPVIGCDCETCTSQDPRDRRTRHGSLLELDNGQRLLIDTPPELRLQLLAAKVARVDGVWITHSHADHLHGFDDLRVFTTRGGTRLPAWVADEFLAEVRSRFAYIFDDSVVPPIGTSKPMIDLNGFDPAEPVRIFEHDFVPLSLPHGPMNVFGFRVGSLGYVTDAKTLSPEVMEKLAGVRTLVINALWWGRPHPTHFNVEEAVEAARAVGAERTWLVHMTHRLRHADLEAKLPSDIRPAFDGLTVDV